MKNLLIVGCALVGFVACRTEKTSVSDPSGANMPKADCCEGKSDAAKADCKDGMKKTECQGMKAKPQG